ncbi:hypothetical protein ENBRE01_1967 [Enteropsectra breve]|nr:hypothetical protein ENBRE01_1967 [Enteropsectra breve]
MDRTNEFQKIVQITKIPQNVHKIHNFGTEIVKKELQVEDLLKKLSKIPIFEAFRIVPLLEQGYKEVADFKNTAVEFADKNADSEEVVCNMQSIIRTKSLRATLKLNEIRRKCMSARKETAKTEYFDKQDKREAGAGSQEMAMALEEEQEQKRTLNEETVQERKRIVKSISEIGQIVEDISIHVSLQEEKLKRIDDTMKRTEKWSKKASKEIKETWDIVNKDRRGLVIFFGIWLIIFLIVWIMK